MMDGFLSNRVSAPEPQDPAQTSEGLLISFLELAMSTGS